MKPTKTHICYFCILLAFGANACVSAKYAMKSTPSAVLANRLPPLEVTMDATALTKADGTLAEDIIPLFRGEVRQNIAEPTDTATFGYAHLLLTQAKVQRTGRALQMLQMATLLIPSVLGIPLETYKTNITAEVEIADAQGQVLGRYTGRGQSSVRVAMYYGYSQQDAPQLANVVALREALGQIRPQIDSAAGRLRPLLLKAGQVDNPTLPGHEPVVISDNR